MGKRIEIKASELKEAIQKAVDEAARPIPNTVLNEIFTMDRINLDEMIYHTIPSERVVRYLKGCFNFADPDDFDIDENYGIAKIAEARGTEVIQLWIREKDEEDVKKIMGKMGWFCLGRATTGMYARPKVAGLLRLQFEKKFDNDKTEEVLEHPYLYHYTTAKAYKKIKRIGLVPKMTSWDLFGGKGKDYTNSLYKNTNDDVNYGRIYLFADIPDKGDPKKYFGDKNSLAKNNEFLLLKIDTKKLPKDIKFYQDIKQTGAVFTYDNIPPSAIELAS